MVSSEAQEVFRWLQEQNETGKDTDHPYFLYVDPLQRDGLGNIVHLGLKTERETHRDLIAELRNAYLIKYQQPRRDGQDLHLAGHFHLTQGV